MPKKIDWKLLIICLAVPLAAGGFSAFLIKDNVELFQWVQKPPLSPPLWLFPAAWTVFYVLMGIASYLVLRYGKPCRSAMVLYWLQLAFNFFWLIIFFNLRAYLIAFFWLILLWILILATALAFGKLSRPAGLLLVPYLIWVTFAGYLNWGVYALN